MENVLKVNALMKELNAELRAYGIYCQETKPYPDKNTYKYSANFLKSQILWLDFYHLDEVKLVFKLTTNVKEIAVVKEQEIDLNDNIAENKELIVGILREILKSKKTNENVLHPFAQKVLKWDEMGVGDFAAVANGTASREEIDREVQAFLAGLPILSHN